MAVSILLRRSDVANKRPDAASMQFGELNLNYDAATGGLYYEGSGGEVIKVGPCQVSATAPNATPAGSAGNSLGEFWYDTATSTLKIWDGAAWQETGGAVQGVTGTAPITVDNTDPLNPVIEVSAASTTAPGVVQLNDTVTSTSVTEALTANQGKVLQDQIDALVISNNLTFAGTIDASTGNLVTVSAEGTAAGFTAGSPLPAADPANAEYFVIVTVAGNMTPPGGVAQDCNQGDWWLSDGTQYVLLTIGFDAPYATDTTPGVIQLATDAEVQAGVEATHAVTSASLQSKISDAFNLASGITIASSQAVKDAFDTLVDAGIASDTVLFVNSTNGDDATATRGTVLPYATITAALAAAQNGDTVILSPGTFTENVTLTKAVTMIGTYQEQALGAGTKILGNFTWDITGTATAQPPSITGVVFQSTNTSPAFTIANNSFASGGSANIFRCAFTQASDTSTTEFCFFTADVNWTRSLYVRSCLFDGNVQHNAGAVTGASGYVVFENTIGTGSATRHYHITSGTVEFRRPSNSLSPVLQTGGGVIFVDTIGGITPSNATTSPVFGGTGISYKGSATALGNTTMYFNGTAVLAGGAIVIGANVIYGWTSLVNDPAALLVDPAAVAYTTAVPAAANAIMASQQRPRFDLLKATSTVAAANQLGAVIDSATGALYSVTAFDAGLF